MLPWREPGRGALSDNQRRDVENLAFFGGGGGAVRPSPLKSLISEERDEMRDNALNRVEHLGGRDIYGFCAR